MPKTEVYKRLRASGTCTSCMKQPADPGKAMCVACKQANISIMQARYRRRRYAGVCGQCGGAVASTRALCEPCRQKQRARIKLMVNDRRRTGLCPRCGDQAASGRVRCLGCTAENRQIFLRRKANGICTHCGSRQATPSKTKCGHCQQSYNTHARERDRRLRAIVLTHYGFMCQCCGEAREQFLAVDHINNDGNSHRKALRKTSINPWLVRNNFPPGFQLLCHNCNMAKALYGECPHTAERVLGRPSFSCDIVGGESKQL